MKRTNVTNNHLRTAIKDIQKHLDNTAEIPHDLFIDFMNELKVSRLLIPAIIQGDTLNFEYLISDEENSIVIPLFSDDEEFVKCYGSDYDYGPVPCDFDYYLDLLNQPEYNGILINVESEELLLESELLLNFPFSQGITFNDNFEGYDAEELLKISKNISNDSLLEYIESGEDNFEALMLELAKSTLLNLVVGDENFGRFAENGIISSRDVGGFDLYTTNVDGEEFGILFTGVDAIKDAIAEDCDENYYQITLIANFFEFVLKNDMGGVIINPGTDDYIIPRSYLLDGYDGIALNNPSFKRAIDYIFLL